MKGAGPVYVAIDQGSHATRTVAFDARGRQLASTFTLVDTRRSGPDRVEHDGGDLIAGVRSALEELALFVPAQRWSAAGLAVQRSTVACWDRSNGELLAPVISWQDRRQAGWLQRLSGHAARIHGITGLPLSPHYGASKVPGPRRGRAPGAGRGPAGRGSARQPPAHVPDRGPAHGL